MKQNTVKIYGISHGATRAREMAKLQIRVRGESNAQTPRVECFLHKLSDGVGPREKFHLKPTTIFIVVCDLSRWSANKRRWAFLLGAFEWVFWANRNWNRGHTGGVDGRLVVRAYQVQMRTDFDDAHICTGANRYVPWPAHQLCSISHAFVFIKAVNAPNMSIPWIERLTYLPLFIAYWLCSRGEDRQRGNPLCVNCVGTRQMTKPVHQNSDAK